MWAPKMEARVLQDAQAARRARSVLEIGTGSGYFTALLASRAARRHERRDRSRARRRARRQARCAHGFANVRLRDRRRRARLGRRALRRDRAHRLDAAAAGEVPARSSSPSGRVFAVVGEAPAMTARLVALDRARRRASRPTCSRRWSRRSSTPPRPRASSFDRRDLRRRARRAGAPTRARAAPLVVDVREPWELEQCRIEGSQSIPLRELPARLAELPARPRRSCSSAITAAAASRRRTWLARTGFAPRAQPRGGVDAWARDGRSRDAAVLNR